MNKSFESGSWGKLFAVLRICIQNSVSHCFVFCTVSQLCWWDVSLCHYFSSDLVTCFYYCA